jgi:hypothetical protein
VTEDWEEGITHVVCAVDENKLAKRTFKYLLGLLGGAHVVTSAWVTACLTAGAPVNEADYLVCGDTAGGRQGPAKSLAAVQSAAAAGGGSSDGGKEEGAADEQAEQQQRRALLLEGVKVAILGEFSEAS